MCMQDIRIGRALASASYTLPMPNAVVTQIAPANPNRIAISISTDGVGFLAVGIGDVVASAGSGFSQPTLNPIHEYRIETYGNALTGPIFGFSGAAQTISIVDCSLQKDVT